jgi:hypothetical protein
MEKEKKRNQRNEFGENIGITGEQHQKMPLKSSPHGRCVCFCATG